MTTLDRRDRRRAAAVIIAASRVTTSPLIHPAHLEPLIAAALKREREETGNACAFHLCPCRMCVETRKAQRGKAS